MESIAYKVITERIIERLEAGVIPWRKPWASGWPKNLVTGLTYRGINTLMLSLAPYHCPAWLTFKQAAALGGTVKKGEKATPVIYWNWKEKEDEQSGKKRNIPILKYYSVFNLEQCEGIEQKPEELEALDLLDEPACDHIADTYFEREKTLKLEPSLDRACYSPSRDVIRMPEMSRFDSNAAYFATLFHEAVHSTGHKCRLDRELSKPGSFFGSEDYSKEELVAELGSAFLCGAAGIDPATLDNSAAYIDGWLKALKDDRRMLVSAGSKAQAAVDFILNGRPEPEDQPATE